MIKLFLVGFFGISLFLTGACSTGISQEEHDTALSDLEQVQAENTVLQNDYAALETSVTDARIAIGILSTIIGLGEESEFGDDSASLDAFLSIGMMIDSIESESIKSVLNSLFLQGEDVSNNFFADLLKSIEESLS